MRFSAITVLLALNSALSVHAGKLYIRHGLFLKRVDTNEHDTQLLSQLVARLPDVIPESILLLKFRSSSFKSNRNENKTDQTARGTRGNLRNF